MSSLSRALGAALLAVALVAPLAACSGLRPVYSDAGLGQKRVDVSYNAPANKLERIIYDNLALKLGKAEGAVPRVAISAWSGGKGLTNNLVGSPTTPRQVTVSANLTVTAPDGTVLFSGVRQQSADFTTDWQALSGVQAQAAAERQAAEILADTLRLQIMAALSKWQH